MSSRIPHAIHFGLLRHLSSFFEPILTNIGIKILYGSQPRIGAADIARPSMQEERFGHEMERCAYGGSAWIGVVWIGIDRGEIPQIDARYNDVRLYSFFRSG